MKRLASPVNKLRPADGGVLGRVFNVEGHRRDLKENSVQISVYDTIAIFPFSSVSLWATHTNLPCMIVFALFLLTGFYSF